MKRRKSRIILGTTAVAAALTFGGCGGSQNTSPAENNTAVTAQENTAETSEQADTSETTVEAATEENNSAATYEIEVFDVNENYNSVVYGPPAEE